MPNYMPEDGGRNKAIFKATVSANFPKFIKHQTIDTEDSKRPDTMSYACNPSTFRD